MDFSDHTTHLVIEVPSTWKSMIYIIICIAVGLNALYGWILWRYIRLSRRNKAWFFALFVCTTIVSLLVIFFENFFED